jgi:hypothetical protein
MQNLAKRRIQTMSFCGPAEPNAWVCSNLIAFLLCCQINLDMGLRGPQPKLTLPAGRCRSIIPGVDVVVIRTAEEQRQQLRQQNRQKAQDNESNDDQNDVSDDSSLEEPKNGSLWKAVYDDNRCWGDNWNTRFPWAKLVPWMASCMCGACYAPEQRRLNATIAVHNLHL